MLHLNKFVFKISTLRKLKPMTKKELVISPKTIYTGKKKKKNHMKRCSVSAIREKQMETWLIHHFTTTAMVKIKQHRVQTRIQSSSLSSLTAGDANCRPLQKVV